MDKTYAFAVKFPLSEEDLTALESGVDIGGYITAPCKVELDPRDPEQRGSSGRITLHEGKYHQIKRMFAAVGCHVEWLKRTKMGGLALDERLAEGECRPLTAAEKSSILNEKN